MHRRLLGSVSSLVLLASVPVGAHAAGALPTGGQFVAGAGSIGPAGASSLLINQATARGIIDWRSFSIGTGASVAINNGSGVTLNRVTGGQLSLIQGSLTATGSLYLVNPQGVVIGPGGQVLAGGGVVISTRNIANDAFMAGGALTAAGTSIGDVTNKGTVLARAGDVVIIGHSVSNTGSITASGTATLAAADSVVLAPVGGVSGVVVASDAGATGDVTQAGRVQAAAAALTAAGGNVYSLAGNSGLVQATGSATVAGHVYLTAGNGAVSIAGAVAAQNADGSGGQIVASGKTVSLASTARLDAGGTRGGEVLVGVTAPQTNLADVTTIADGAQIIANGTAGLGGHIETSGHVFTLGAAGIDAGQGGSWLVDPTNLTVTDATPYNTTLAAGTATTITTTGNLTISTATPIAWSTAASLAITGGQATSITSAITGSGTGGLTVTSGAGAITIAAAVSANTVSMTATGGNLAINSGSITGHAAGSTAVTLNTTANFVNSAGAGAVTASGAGASWRVYSTNPALDTTGGLTPAFYQYNAAIGAGALGTGNGLLYSIAPAVSYSVTGSVSKTYDSFNTATGLTSANISATGLINGDAVAPTGGTGTYSQADVGNSLTVAIAGVSFTHGSAPVYGYTLASAQNLGVIGSITPKTLGVTLGGTLDKTYDGTPAANLTSANLSVTGTVAGQGITVGQPFSAVYGSADAGVQTLTVSLSTTSYVAAAGTKLTNYVLPDAPNAGPATGTILQASLQVLGLQANNKVYDGTDAATLNVGATRLYGAVAGDNVTLVTTGYTAAFSDPNVGAHPVTVANLVLGGSKAADYVIITPTGLSANITAAPLTITGITANSKTYDGTNAATLDSAGAALVGMVAADQGDAARLALTTSTTGSFAQANVGNGIAVTAAPFGLTGSSAGNYSLARVAGLSADITPALLTVTLGGTTAKTYDATTSATVDPADYTVTGWIVGQGGGVAQTASAVYANANAGTPAVTATLEVSDFRANPGTLLSNYTVAAMGPQTFHDVIIGAGLINTAPLTVSLTGNPTKVYDATTNATGTTAALTSGNFLLQGFITGQGASISLTAATSLASQFASANAGVGGITVPLTDADFAVNAGTLLANYHYNTPVTGFGTITPAVIGVSPTGILASVTGNPTKVYDGTTATFGTTAQLNAGNFAFTGFLGGDGATVDVSRIGAALFASPHVGVQAISVDLTPMGAIVLTGGALASNYTLPTTAYGFGTITPKDISNLLSIVGNPTKVYDGTTDAALSAASYSLAPGALAGGDAITFTQQRGVYASANAGMPGVTAAIPVSDILAGGATQLSDYILPTTASGMGTINQAPLVVLNAHGVSKTYNGNAAATLNTAGDSLFGVVSTDSIALTSPTTGTFSQKDVGTGLAITPTTPFTVSGAATGNYILTQPVLTANITKATLTIASASADDKVYDGTTAATVNATGLTGVVTSAGAAGPDDVTLITGGSTANFATANVGDNIRVTTSGFTLGGSLAMDYTLRQPTLFADITPATLTAAIVSDPTKTYDGGQAAILNAGNYSLTGFVHGEGGDVTVIQAASAAYASADAAANVGVTATLATPDFAAITTQLSNYALPTTATGVGTINRAALIAQIVNNPTKVYDGDTDTLGTTASLAPGDYSVLGFVAGQGATVTQHAGQFATPNAGITTITAGLMPADFAAANLATNLNNYILPVTASGAGTITPRTLAVALTVTLDPQTKVYDGTTLAVLNPSDFHLSGFLGLQTTTLNQTVGSYNSPDVATATSVTTALGVANFNAGANGFLASNYSLPTTVTGLGSITPRTVTAAIIGDPTKIYDGTTGAVLTSANYDLSGFVGGQGAAVIQTAGAYNSPDVLTANTVSANIAGALMLSGGAQATNYILPTFASGAGRITPAVLTAAIVGTPTKPFDGSTAATLTGGNYLLTGFAAGQEAAINQASGTYGLPFPGPETVSASLSGVNFLATGSTLLSNYRLPTTASGPGLITGGDALSIIGRRGIFALADPRTYIPYPTPGALSYWRNNGWGPLPIVLDDTTDFTQAQDDDGNVAVQSGPTLLNNPEQVLLSGSKDKQWRITVPQFRVPSTLGAFQMAAPSPPNDRQDAAIGRPKDGVISKIAY